MVEKTKDKELKVKPLKTYKLADAELELFVQLSYQEAGFRFAIGAVTRERNELFEKCLERRGVDVTNIKREKWTVDRENGVLQKIW